MYVQFTKAVKNIVPMSQELRVSVLVAVRGVDVRYDGRRLEAPRGYVTSKTSGVSVWRVKYTGKVCFCNVENCGRGRTRKAMTPETKDWKSVEPRRVP
jgi:hypothetical protein